jgi:hypothetical protein
MAIKPKLPAQKAEKYKGQVKGDAAPGDAYADPYMAHDGQIQGMDSLRDDIGEKSGFETSGYIDKKGTPYGEAAKFNFLPPGMEIDDQENADIRSMPYKEVTDMSYPGDGWEPGLKKGVKGKSM